MEGDEMNEKSGDKSEERHAGERDRTQLPTDLLHVIYEQLSDCLDCIYFCSTCKAWNLPVALPEATPCHPWLFDPYKSYDSSFHFYALTSNATISVPARDDNLTFNRSQYHNTSYNGYLLYYHHDTASYYFINPLTGEENVLLKFGRDVLVPSHLFRVLRAQDAIVISTIHVSRVHVLEVDSYLCTVTFHQFKGGEDGWERVDRVPMTLIGKNVAFELYKERYFINTDLSEKTTVIGATTGEYADIVTLPEVEDPVLHENGERLLRKFNYLVKSSGELLLIHAVAYIRRPVMRRYTFSVYRLEDGDNITHWVMMMRGIGDRAIFLNEFDGFSLESDKYPRLKKNSIYFMRSTTRRVIGDDDADDNPFNNNRTVIIASRYDLETGLVEDFPYTMTYWGSWFLPSLYC